MPRALALAAVTGSLSLVSASFARAEPGGLDFSLGGAAGLDLRSTSLYAGDIAPAATGGAAASGPGLLSAVAPVSLGADDGGGKSTTYIAARGGPLFYIGDLEDLGTGFTIEGAVGIQPIRFLAIEIQSGYFWGEDNDGTLQADLWGIPLLVNAKLCIPIFFLELYGGLGLGGYYVHAEADSGVVDDDEDDVVFGGNAFVGVDLDLGPLFVGVEGKYILTADVDAPGGGNFTLEGFAAMAVVGLRL
jgi:hypothetical protein